MGGDLAQSLRHPFRLGLISATKLAFPLQPAHRRLLTMKRILLSLVLAASALLIVSCKSPKGNIPAYGFQSSRPTPLQ